MARSCDLHGRGRQHVSWRGVRSSGGDCPQRRISARHAVDAPTHQSVSGVCHGCREGRLGPKHHRSARWIYAHRYRCRRRLRREWWLRGASSSTTERPSFFSRNDHDQNRCCSGSRGFVMRERPHALRKSRRRASEKGEYRERRSSWLRRRISQSKLHRINGFALTRLLGLPTFALRK